MLKFQLQKYFKQMKWMFSLGLLFWMIGGVNGQNQVTDSLLLRIKETKTSEEKVKLLNALSFELRNRYPDSAGHYAEEALQLARGTKYPHGEARSIHSLGNIAYKKGVFKEAIDHYQEAIKIRQLLDDSLGIADDYQGLGNAHRRLGEFSKALSFHLECLRVRETYQAPPLQIAHTLVNIGNVYYSIKEYDKAIENYDEVIRRYEGMNNWHDIAVLLNNIFVIYYSQGKYEESLPYLNRSLAINDSLENTIQKAVNLSNLAEVYIQLERFQEAYPKANQALELYKSINDSTYIQSALINLGSLNRHLNQPDKAISYFNQSLEFALAKNQLENVQDIYQNLSGAYAEKGDYQSALEAQKTSEIYKDSLTAMASLKELNETKTQYETEQVEMENERLRLDQTQRKRTTRMLVFGLAGLFLLVFLTFWALQQRNLAYKRLQAQKEEMEVLLEEKERLLTDLKTTQVQLLQSEKMASIGQLTAGIAHELNNPIGFVSANAVALKQDVEELRQLIDQVRQLQKNPTPEVLEATIATYKALDIEYIDQELVELVESIIRGSERTRDIVTSLRTFSRNTTEEFAFADIHEGLDSTLIILNSYLGDRITVHKDYGDLPSIRCQITKLNQVFLNILNNAVQSIKGQGDIFIKTWQDDQNNVVLSIKDTGSGMSETTRNRIFEPFFTTKDVGEGTGLGLSISYSIIEQHKGEIKVVSEPGKGTAFIISLPIKE